MPNKKNKGFRRIRPNVTSPKAPNRAAKRKQWTDAQMLSAVKDVERGHSINKSADLHGIPRSTLKDRISGRTIHGINPGPVPYLTAEEERLLSDHLLKVAAMGYGKTRRDVCLIVESYLKQKGTLHNTRLSNGWWDKL